jgi:hypothetical protein
MYKVKGILELEIEGHVYAKTPRYRPGGRI